MKLPRLTGRGFGNPRARGPLQCSKGVVMAKKRIGILTGGGDVPGLNSVIKTVT